MHQIMLFWLTFERSCLIQARSPTFKVLSMFLLVRFLSSFKCYFKCNYHEIVKPFTVVSKYNIDHV